MTRVYSLRAKRSETEAIGAEAFERRQALKPMEIGERGQCGSTMHRSAALGVIVERRWHL